MPVIDERRAARLFRAARAERWDVTQAVFAEALERSSSKAFAGRIPSAGELDRYLDSLHLDDLAFACACALGHDAAWEHFMLEHRPALYRAADAMDQSGGAREVADSLYAELYGVRSHGGERQSLFRYFHGRSSLGTWLRAVLSQRWVDRVRATRRLESLPDEESPAVLHSPTQPDGAAAAERRRFRALVQQALAAAIAALVPRDRLRLGCYYAQEMTLAQTGRILGEHEATVSRHLARTRRAIREAVEDRLRTAHQLGDREIDECFASVTEDAGAMDLTSLVQVDGDRKKPVPDRSRREDVP